MKGIDGGQSGGSKSFEEVEFAENGFLCRGTGGKVRLIVNNAALILKKSLPSDRSIRIRRFLSCSEVFGGVQDSCSLDVKSNRRNSRVERRTDNCDVTRCRKSSWKARSHELFCGKRRELSDKRCLLRNSKNKAQPRQASTKVPISFLRVGV